MIASFREIFFIIIPFQSGTNLYRASASQSAKLPRQLLAVVCEFLNRNRRGSDDGHDFAVRLLLTTDFVINRLPCHGVIVDCGVDACAGSRLSVRHHA